MLGHPDRESTGGAVNVIIQINGREAIPVRALPWLTHNRLFSAQDVADALSLSAEFPEFSSVHPFRIDDGIVGTDFWRNEVQGKFKRLEAQGLDSEQWRLDSLASLPAGVFVWRGEWQQAYSQSPHGLDALVALGNAADKQDIAARTLNFEPHIPPDLVQMVLEGCSPHSERTAVPPVEANTEPLPVVVASDGPSPLTTSEIAGSFAGYHGWDSAKWKDNLQSPAPWLKACRDKPGKQGRPITESTWWPVQIAVELDKKHTAIRRNLHARFKSQEPLRPWLETIKNHLPDDSET